MFCAFSLCQGWSNRSYSSSIHLLYNSRSTLCIGCVTTLTFWMLVLYYFGKNKQQFSIFSRDSLPMIVTNFDEYGQLPRT